MKKTLLTIITLIFCLSISLEVSAQEIKRPLADKEETEAIPKSPGENYAWVKAHWYWDGGRYKWRKGVYVEKRQGYIWIDGEWERSRKSGWWKYNKGYWRKDSEISKVKNDENTSIDDKKSKEKRQENKKGGLYIKTGSSK